MAQDIKRKNDERSDKAFIGILLVGIGLLTVLLNLFKRFGPRQQKDWQVTRVFGDGRRCCRDGLLRLRFREHLLSPLTQPLFRCIPN